MCIGDGVLCQVDFYFAALAVENISNPSYRSSSVLALIPVVKGTAISELPSPFSHCWRALGQYPFYLQIFILPTDSMSLLSNHSQVADMFGGGLLVCAVSYSRHD